jgi:hypothetical protein
MDENQADLKVKIASTASYNIIHITPYIISERRPKVGSTSSSDYTLMSLSVMLILK